MCDAMPYIGAPVCRIHLLGYPDTRVLFPSPLNCAIYSWLLARLLVTSVTVEKAGTEKRCAFVPDVRGASKDILRIQLFLRDLFSTLGTNSLKGFACVSAAVATEGLGGT